MFKFIKGYIGGIYYLLFFISYFSIYFSPSIVPFLNVVILILSYHLIIVKKRFDVVISLILFSRCLNGFLIPHNKMAFLLINLLTNVIPFLFYCWMILRAEKVLVKTSVFKKYKYTLLFFVLLSFSFLINIFTSYDIITKRYLPFLFFIFFIILNNHFNNFNVHGVIHFFRATFFSSLIVFSFSSYLNLSKILVESDSVFSIVSPTNSFNLVYLSFTRNFGYFWDHRILGIFAYLFLLLVLIYKPKYYKIDILLSSVVVISTISRGSILTYGLILLAYFFITYKNVLLQLLLFYKKPIAVILLIFISFSYFNSDLVSSSASDLIKTFNPVSQRNALSQRAELANYALDSFYDSPVLGNGMGYLTSKTIERSVLVDGKYLSVITDAFLFIILGEMGIVGFILFLLFLIEVFYTKNLLSIALFTGFIIQLLGTDIPDMRFFYFAILVVVFIANQQIRDKIYNSRGYTKNLAN